MTTPYINCKKINKKKPNTVKSVLLFRHFHPEAFVVAVVFVFSFCFLVVDVFSKIMIIAFPE